MCWATVWATFSPTHLVALTWMQKRSVKAAAQHSSYNFQLSAFLSCFNFHLMDSVSFYPETRITKLFENSFTTNQIYTFFNANGE
jgi:hypothetical protein